MIRWFTISDESSKWSGAIPGGSIGEAVAIVVGSGDRVVGIIEGDFYLLV